MPPINHWNTRADSGWTAASGERRFCKNNGIRTQLLEPAWDLWCNSPNMFVSQTSLGLAIHKRENMQQTMKQQHGCMMHHVYCGVPCMQPYDFFTSVKSRSPKMFFPPNSTKFQRNFVKNINFWHSASFSLGDFPNSEISHLVPHIPIIDFRFHKSFDVFRSPIGSSFRNFINLFSFFALWHFRLENIGCPPLLKQKHHLAAKASRQWKPVLTPFYNFDFWYCSESNLTLIFQHEIYSNQVRLSFCELDQTQIINKLLLRLPLRWIWFEWPLFGFLLSICKESPWSWWRIWISLSFAHGHQKN